MRGITSGELDRIKAVAEQTFGSSTGIGFDARIASVTAGHDDTARTTIIAIHPCRNLQPMNGQEKERANMANVVKGFRCFCKVSSLIHPRHRLMIENGGDYRIVNVIKKPENNPIEYELHLEDEGIAT